MNHRLNALEQVIDKRRRSFYQIGKALRQIRDERLYRELLYDTFEEYLRKRWDMGRSQAYRLIEASRVIDNLSPIGDILPQNEAQSRSLRRLKPVDQRRLWQDFLAAGVELNARNIARFAARFANRKKAGIDLTAVIAPGFKAAVKALMEQISMAQQDRWRATSRQAGLFWLRVLRDKILAKQ